MLKAVDGKVTLADGNTVVTDDTVVAAFLGDWNPFAGKDMSIAETTPSEVVNNIPKETGLYVRFVDEWGAPASAAPARFRLRLTRGILQMKRYISRGI